MTILILKSVELIYPQIYTGSSFEGASIRYRTAFTTNKKTAKELAKVGVYPKGPMDLYNTNGAYGPTVTCHEKNYNGLLAALALADARNIPRNNLFRNVTADLVVKPYDYEHDDRKGVGMTVIDVLVDANDLNTNAVHFGG